MMLPTPTATVAQFSDGVRPSNGLLTKEELAAELRCSPRQIERLQLARRIPFVKLSGRMVRYRRDAVLNALAKMETEAVCA